MGDEINFCGFDVQEYQSQLFTVQSDLGTQLEQHKTLVDENAKTNGEPAPGKLTQPTEDPSEKVDRFEGGVDEIADQIEDLQAFEDLCEALDDDEPHQSALSRVRGSGPYKKLCEMWAGALEGGSESSRMQRAFNNMFDGRGFWASTEKAFSMVASAAKRDAVLPKEARDAKGKAQDAKGKGTEGNDAKNNADKGDKGKGTKGGDGGKGANDPLQDAAEAQYKNKDVDSPKNPPVASYDRAEKAHGLSQSPNSAFALATREYEFFGAHQQKIKTAAEGGVGDRWSLVWRELGNGLLGGATKGFIDQVKDGLVADVLGGLLDKGLTVATKGAIKAPLIGPALTLFQSGLVTDVLSGHALDGKFAQGLKKQKDAIVSSGKSIGSNFMKAWNGDGAGYLAAAAADLFTMLGGIVDMASQILGVLSALSFVLGGILVLVGLALTWLFGVGLPLVTAGGWLIKAGTVLSKIVTVLGPIGLALGALATFFRTLAAMTVPAEAFAEQLVGVNENASKFGEKAGAKVADTAISMGKEKVAKAIQPKAKQTTATAAGQEGKQGQGDGDAQGTDRSNKAKEQADGAEKGLGEVKQLKAQQEAENQRILEQQKQNKEQKKNEANSKKNNEGDDNANPDAKNKKPGEEGDLNSAGQSSTTRAKVLSALKTGFGTVATILNPWSGAKKQFKEAGEALGEAKRLLTDAKNSSREGLREALGPEMLDAYKKKREDLLGGKQKLQDKFDAAEGKAKELNQKHQELQKKLAELKEEQKKLTGDDPEVAKKRQEVSAQLKDISAEAKKQQKLVDEADATFKAIKDEVDFLNTPEARPPKAGDFDVDKDKKVKEAKERLAKAETELERAKVEHERAKKAHEELTQKKGRLLDEAKRADQDAQTVRDAEQRVKGLEEIKQRLDSFEAKQESLRQAQQALKEAQATHAQQSSALKKAQEDVAQTQEQLQQQKKTRDETISDFVSQAQSRRDGRITVELDGRNTERRVLGANENGVTVTNGQGGSVVVPWSQVKTPKYLAEHGQKVLASQQKVGQLQDQLKGHQETVKTTQDGISKAQEAITTNEKASKDTTTQEELNQKIADATQYHDAAGGYDAAKGNLARLTQGGGAQTHDQKAQGLRDEAGLLEPELQKAGSAELQARGAMRQQEQALKDARENFQKTESQAQKSAARSQAVADQLTMTSSGNAMGGVGSSYKEFIALYSDGTLSGYLDDLKGKEPSQEEKASEEKKRRDEERKREQQAQGALADLQKGDQKDDPPLPDPKEQEKGLIERWNALGQPWAEAAAKTFGPSYKQVIQSPAPPKDPAALHKTFEEAHEAMGQYAQHWLQAYLWSEAEKMAEKKIEDAETTDKTQGEQVKKQLGEAKQKGDDLVKKEDERTQKAQTKEPGTKKKDGEQGGMIEGLITRLMEHAGYLRTSPDKSSVSRSNKMVGDAQDQSDEKAKKGKETTVKGSQDQKKALQSMNEVRQSMEQQTEQMREQLRAKIGKDKMTLEEMRAQKAQSLMKAEEQGNTARDKSDSFNADLDELLIWAQAFKKAREGMATP